MAYYDILAGTSYGRFNIKLAKLTNLPTACYWSCLMNIISAVNRKRTYNEEGYFPLDRKYVEAQTTLSPADQQLCDKALAQLNVLASDPVNPDSIKVDVGTMTSILISDDTKVLKTVTKIAKVSRADKAAGKREGVINRLQNRLTEPCVELSEAYKKWIEAVYSKGMQSNAQMDLFIDTINGYTTDVEVKVEIVNIAVAQAYKVADWAIQIYERNHGKAKSATRPNAEQKIATAIDETITF